MEISKHIKDLLYTHDHVVLSGFGAFLTKYSSAKINKDTNTMSPPCKEIIFDGNLKKNDSLLENYIKEKENISLDESRKHINKYVNTVNTKLKAGKKVRFAEIGIFYLSKNKSIVFDSISGDNLLFSSYGLSKIKLPDDVVKNIKTAIVPAEKEKKKGIFWIILTLVAVILIAIISCIYLFKPNYLNEGKNYVVNIYENIRNGKTKDKNNETVKDSLNISDIDNLKSDTTNIFDKKDDDKANEDTTKTDTIDAERTEINENISDSLTLNDNSIPETIEDSIPIKQYETPKKGRFYLIVSSLSSLTSAKNVKAKFLKSSVTVEIIIIEEKMFRLSIGDHATMNEAINQYNSFHTRYPDVVVWIWKNK